MPTYIAYADTIGSIDVKCESCGHNYNYKHSVKVQAESLSKQEAQNYASDKRRKEIIDRRRYNAFGHHRCPKCRYMQSWMVYSSKTREGKTWALVAIPLIAIMVLCLGTSVMVLSALGGNALRLVEGGTSSWVYILIVGVPLAFIAWLVYKRVFESYNPNEDTESSIEPTLPKQITPLKVTFDPDPALPVYDLGVASLAKGDYDLAFAKFNLVMEVSPNFKDVYAQRGLAQLGRGNKSLALTDLQTYVRQVGNNASPEILNTIRNIEEQISPSVS